MKESTKIRIKGLILLPVVILMSATILPLAILMVMLGVEWLGQKIIFPFERIIIFIFGEDPNAVKPIIKIDEEDW